MDWRRRTPELTGYASGLERASEVLDVAERTFGDRLDPGARFFVEQLFEG